MTGSTWPIRGSTTSAKQTAIVEKPLLPLGALDAGPRLPRRRAPAQSQYEFLPSAESILEEVGPTSFKVKLFKCFLDAAVSEQVARMVAMKAATKSVVSDPANCRWPITGHGSREITGEIMEIIGGVEARKTHTGPETNRTRHLQADANNTRTTNSEHADHPHMATSTVIYQPATQTLAT